MTTYLKYYLVFILIIMSADLHSQIRSGQTIGMNLSNMTVISSGNAVDAENSTGIHFGGVLDIPVAGHFTFRPAILFSGKGSMYKTDTTDISISPVYIEVPALAVYTFGSHVLKISLFTGPYIAFGFGGTTIKNGGAANTLNYGSGEDDNIRHFDAGVNFGAGIIIKDLIISFQYGLGLADITPASEADTEIKNKVVGISVSSFFEGK